MTKGRRVPEQPPIPPWRVVRTDVRSMADVLEALGPGAVGVHMLRYEHDDGCPAARTQRIEDCVCNPDVSLLRYEKGTRR